MTVNAFALLLYIMLIAMGERASILIAVPLLLWGFIAYRWVAQDLLGGAFMVVDVSFSRMALVILFGSVFFAVLGILIIPFLLAYQASQLVNSRK